MVDTVIFDWGDTLMVNIPGARGAMVDWPEVWSVAGSEQALQQLASHYRLVVATNASDSTVHQVKMALARVKLDGYFTEIFTMHELGSMKPDQAFFQGLLTRLGCQPQQAVMVGDSFTSDILPAHQLGLRTVWYNPAGIACYPLPPVQNDEINDMAFLPQVLTRWDKPVGALPDINTCLGWLAEHSMLPKGVDHSPRVADTAYLLGCWLRQRGVVVDPLLAHRGGLLHDLDKAEAAQQGRVHGELAAEILLRLGQPALASTALRHVIYKILDPANGPQNWEEKLVFYADKLVEGSQLVSLEVRLAALKKRYPTQADRIQQCYPQLLHLQNELCERLGKTSVELLDDLQRYPSY